LLFLPDSLLLRNLLYFSSLHSSVIIMLKASLKWVPLVGPAMQMFRFIFMERNWGKDRESLGKALTKLGDRAGRSLDSMVLFVCQRNPLSKKNSYYSNRRSTCQSRKEHSLAPLRDRSARNMQRRQG